VDLIILTLINCTVAMPFFDARSIRSGFSFVVHLSFTNPFGGRLISRHKSGAARIFSTVSDVANWR
jgi:hypothetical protein